MSKAHARDGVLVTQCDGSTLGRIWLDSKAYREGIKQEELGESIFVFGRAKLDIECDRRN